MDERTLFVQTLMDCKNVILAALTFFLLGFLKLKYYGTFTYIMQNVHSYAVSVIFGLKVDGWQMFSFVIFVIAVQKWYYTLCKQTYKFLAILYPQTHPQTQLSGQRSLSICLFCKHKNKHFEYRGWFTLYSFNSDIKWRFIPNAILWNSKVIWRPWAKHVW